VNDLVYRDGAVYTVAVSVSDRNKDEIAGQILSLLGLDWGEAVAVGDGEADLPMLKKAGYPIAFNPATEEVARAAKGRHKGGDAPPPRQVFKGATKARRVMTTSDVDI